MKKLIVSVFAFCSLSFGISVGGFELSPEVGAGLQKFSMNGGSQYNWTAHARLWVGVSNFIVAPQFKYTSIDDNEQTIKNSQFGASFGYTFDLAVLYATPYIGFNYSTFSEYYDSTLAGNIGLRVNPAILPFSVSLEYEYQNPNLINESGKRVKMESMRLSVGLSF